MVDGLSDKDRRVCEGVLGERAKQGVTPIRRKTAKCKTGEQENVKLRGICCRLDSEISSNCCPNFILIYT
jgi:hypothetical protein